MALIAFLNMIPALFGLALQSQAPPEPGVRRVVIRDELIISIPVRPRSSHRIVWTEQKGPKCVPVKYIAGAMLSGPSSIDFVMRDRSRIRAVMDNECPALDFYRGVYFQLNDERICAKREAIRSRIGGSCRIERFRTLIPQVRQVGR